MTDPVVVPDPAPAPTPAHAASQTKDHMLSNELYTVLKFCALTLFPAVGTLYFTLSGIWGLPNAEQVIGSITAFDLFLGVLLGISTASYNNSDTKFDGTMNVAVDPATQKTTYQLVLDTPLDDLEKKEQITFNVNPVVHDS